MTDTIPVFVDATTVRVPRTATALDAVRACQPDAAREVEQGARTITDSRGLPIAPDTPVHGGAIYRLVAARAHPHASDAERAPDTP